MQQRNRFAYVYLIIGAVVLFTWPMLQNAIWPPVVKPRMAKPDEMGLVLGTMGQIALHPDVQEAAIADFRKQAPGLVGGALVTTAIEVEAPRLAALERQQTLHGTVGSSLAATAIDIGAPQKVAKEMWAANAQKALGELLPMGRGDKPFHLQVLLNTRGGSIQQVVLTHFQQADREGLPVKLGDKPMPFHLIPGVRVPRTEFIREQRQVSVPVLEPGPITVSADELATPSYLMYHYEHPSDERPADTLSRRMWKIAQQTTADDGNTQTVRFETELGAPHYVRISKTYTLKRNEYHIGFDVQIERVTPPEGEKAEPFRYQIDGPRNIPIEGEWYTSTYRQGIVGWVEKGSASRTLEDPREVRNLEGSDPHIGTPNKPLRYAGVMVQYFASVLALSDQQPANQQAAYLDRVRFTPEGATNKDKPFLDDLTFRAISKELTNDDFKSGTINHPYVLYHGPVKVRLLKQLEGEQAVPEETVNRYRDALALNTLTDAPMPNFLGKFANFIFWTDIVIVFTNLIHSLIGLLSHLTPNLAICVMIVTLIVRGLLFPFSRRQSLNAKIMQEKQAKLAPEIKKLTDKYGSDFQRLNQEKMKLYKEHGINPAAAMGGCLLLFAQMPVFMGLYYALQESVFFRLESFLWMPNLAAPDMLFWWSEKIPFLAKPEDLGGSLYLGPYFNLLPLIAVTLMMYVQSKMMPKSEDPQIQMQQKMMKFMMVIFALFFYKVAAGLCIYFICSSLWGMIERKLLPKTLPGSTDPNTPVAVTPTKPTKGKPEAPKGWWGKKKAVWRAKWEKLLEDAQKQQQIRRDDNNRGKKKR